MVIVCEACGEFTIHIRRENRTSMWYECDDCGNKE